ncbi:MAG: glutaredoxin domain-containing protein [Anaerolineales bacterium]|jgi:mycoredoxin
MLEEKIIFYGVKWCWQSRRARHLLDKHNVPYKFVNIDKDKDGELFVLKTNKGMRSVPTIVFEDGSILVEPTNSQIEEKLGMS